jgi:hypothetical protein
MTLLERHTATALTVAWTTSHAWNIWRNALRHLAAATSTTSELHLSHLGIGETIGNASRTTLYGTNRNTLAEVLWDLLVRIHATTALLAGESTGVLARASTRDTSHDHAGLRSESQTALTSVGWKEALLSGSVEDGWLHVLGS